MTQTKTITFSLFFLMGLSYAAPKPVILNVGTRGDELAFDKTQLTAKPKQPIQLTFTNRSGKSAGLQHNWVLVNPGTTEAVAQAGTAAGLEKGYIPQSTDVIAHTSKLLSSGEKETIQFKAPEKPGDYPYICTFPGHYSVMKGVLTVK
jgi:azurin